MRKLTAGEVVRMTASQVESFNDTCILFRHTSGQDTDTGEVGDSFDSGATISCGFVESQEYKNERGQIITIDADALLRLPYTQGVAVMDKVTTHGKTYIVDGVMPGRNVKTAKLLEISI
jgi:hypothetical protein